MEVNEHGNREYSPSTLASLMRARERAERRAKELADLVDAHPGASRVTTSSSPTPDAMLNGITFRGRCFYEPYVSITAQDEQVVIRLDCNRDSEVWAEIIITAAALAELLAQVVVQRPNYEPALLDVLRVAGKKF